MNQALLSERRGRDVSRETFQRLESFIALLNKWNPRINLVSKSTLSDVWNRHIIDSIQVFDIAPHKQGIWIDLGTGGGFPGMVAAILAAEDAPDLAFTFVESDQRKAAFLATAVRDLGLIATVGAQRAETLAPAGADILSARALAPLSALLAMAARHLLPSGVAILPKGANHQPEIDAALETWAFTLQKHPSKTDPLAAILVIEGLTPCLTR